MGDAGGGQHLADPLIAFMNGGRRPKPAIELIVGVKAVHDKLRLSIPQGEGLINPADKITEPLPRDGEFQNFRVAGIVQGIIDPFEMHD